MLLTITTTHRPATDLGHLLHKHPDNVRTVTLPFGEAHVFFPEAGEARCTAALAVEVDQVRITRPPDGSGPGPVGGDGFLPAGPVTDRAYVASSLLSGALARLFGTAMAGRCDARPDLPDTSLPFEVEMPVVPCAGGPGLVERLFEPLGYEVATAPVGWDGDSGSGSPYVAVDLVGKVRLADLLAHLYVLLPVLDDGKHYGVGDAEVDKLVAKGEPWLARHPERELIVRRYLRHDRALAASARGRLGGGSGDVTSSAGVDGPAGGWEAQLEGPLGLGARRLGAVASVLRSVGAERVVDIGCGDGLLLELLVADDRFTELVGADVSLRSLERAARRLRPGGGERVRLLQTGLTYEDRRLAGFDAATLVEVIEHVDPRRLDALAQMVFDRARPGAVVLTTPNREYNVRFPELADGQLRHPGHRFEWTREELAAWAEAVSGDHGYTVELRGVGEEDPVLGPPTQMAVFTR